MKTERSKIIPQIIIFIFILGASCCAWGASWTVGPGGDFTNIQAAIDAAAPSDTINVAEGIYSEQIIVNKTGITLEGETNKYPAICGPCGTTGGSGVINIQANNITIKGLEVYDSDGVYSFDTAAIWANWGGPGFVPAQGDYNTDGISDLATYYDGYWFVETVDGTLILYAENWGAEGYDPVGT